MGVIIGALAAAVAVWWLKEHGGDLFNPATTQLLGPTPAPAPYVPLNTPAASPALVATSPAVARPAAPVPAGSVLDYLRDTVTECLPSPSAPASIRDPRYFQTTGSAAKGCPPVVYERMSMGRVVSSAEMLRRIGATPDAQRLIPDGHGYELLRRMQYRQAIPGFDSPETTGKEPLLTSRLIEELIGEENMVDPFVTPKQAVNRPGIVNSMRTELGYPIFSDARSVRQIRFRMWEMAHEHPELVEGVGYYGNQGTLWGSYPGRQGWVATTWDGWNKYFAAVTGLPGPDLSWINLYHPLDYIPLTDYWEARNVSGFGSPDDTWWNESSPNSLNGLAGLVARNLRGL